MSLYSSLAGKGKSGFGYGSTAEQVTDGLSLAGKTILVTGCNSGLGLETVRVLAMRGAKVVGTARTVAKANEALAPLGANTLGIACELSDPKSVMACVATAKEQGLRFDALIANAGIMALPKLETAHGYELQFFTNHIGHFILVTGLLDSLTDNARVVMLSSSAHTQAPKGGIEFDNLDGKKRYTPWGAYGQSKISNLLFAKELARKFAGTKKTANAVHPGVIQTNLGRNMGLNAVLRAGFSAMSAMVLKNVGEGAATQCYVAVNPGAEGINGEYFADCNVAKCREDAKDPALAKKLWDRSEQIVAEVTKG